MKATRFVADTGIDSSSWRVLIILIPEILLIKFSKDRVVQPPESAWFEAIDKNGDLIPLEESEFYKRDLLGRKTISDN
jgi:hypothetical protein